MGETGGARVVEIWGWFESMEDPAETEGEFCELD
jgi:hypothetical protein